MSTDRSTQSDRLFRFGPFELSEGNAELRKNGVRIKLQEQPFRVLAELASNAGRIVTREELQQKLWSADTFVDFDVGLNSIIRKLRQALGDDADNPHYIETIAKRGYRFLDPVSEITATPVSDGEAALGARRDGALRDSYLPTSAETGGESVAAALPKTRWWCWILAASLPVALLIYGAFLARRGMKSTPPLAIEQRITANPSEAPITAAAISPDGKYVAYADTTGVYIRHIDTGETRPLRLPKEFDAAPTSWFPDGMHLLLTGEAAQGIPSLWKVSILGGGPQQLMENASEAAISPDGSKIAFLRGDAAGSLEIWVMGADGSSLRRISDATVPEASVPRGYGTASEPLTGVHLSGVAWSPDGGRLAYFRRLESSPLAVKHSLETVDVNGGMPRVLMISTQLLPVVCWAVDGRLLYAYQDDPASERDDSGIWSLRVNQKSGDPEGKPLQLTRGVGRIGGMSVTSDGKRLVLWRVNSFPQVFLSEIDAKTGRFKTPRRLTLDESFNQPYAWTPDSRAVLFSSNRSGTTKLYRQAIDQAVPEVLVEGRGLFLYRLNPDGTEILYVDGFNSRDPAQRQRVMSVPLQGGNPRVVLQWPSIHNIQCARSPSKLCLFDSLEGSTAHFFTFDPEDGKTRDFASFPVTGEASWSLSPDGSQLALILHGAERRVTFMVVSDKTTHEVELNPWPPRNIDWAADGKSVFVSSRTANGTPVILGLEPNGNHRVLLEGDGATQLWWAVSSPDGRYAALGEVTGANNVWMVENF
jgi:Tol biopolymer transport system component/DNA-binding winged helix-turn-helix (wHTH) protein